MSYSTTTTVTVPAPSRALTTLETVKDDLGITGTDEDAYIGRLIARSSNAVSRWCRRTFASETLVDTFRWVRPRGGSHLTIFGDAGIGDAEPLILSRCPVTDIQSVTIDGVDLVGSIDYELDAGAGLLYRLGPTGLRRDWRFSAGKVTFTAGFILPLDNPEEGAPARTLPDDVEAGTIEMIKIVRSGRTRDPSIKVELVTDVSRIEYFDPQVSGGADMPPSVCSWLETHRLPLVTL